METTDDEAPRVVRAPMTEAEGCALLKARFEAGGYAIEERYHYVAEGVDVTLDGYDPAARVGYEYLTSEAGDRAEFTPDVVARLEAAMRKGELFLFLIDEKGVDPDRLGLAAERFLARLKQVREGGA